MSFKSCSVVVHSLRRAQADAAEVHPRLLGRSSGSFMRRSARSQQAAASAAPIAALRATESSRRPRAAPSTLDSSSCASCQRWAFAVSSDPSRGSQQAGPGARRKSKSLQELSEPRPGKGSESQRFQHFGSRNSRCSWALQPRPPQLFQKSAHCTPPSRPRSLHRGNHGRTEPWPL